MNTYMKLLLLFLAALIAYTLYHSSSKIAVGEHYKIKAEQLSKQLRVNSDITAAYQKANAKLSDELSKVNNQLLVQKLRSSRASGSLSKVLSTSWKQVSSAGKDAACDSLIEAASAFQIETEKTDSLQEEKISSLEAVCLLRANEVQRLSSSLDSCQASLIEAYRNLEDLSKANSKLQRQNSWARFKTSVLAIAGSALGVALAIILIK